MARSLWLKELAEVFYGRHLKNFLCLCSESTPQGIIPQAADGRFSNIGIISGNPIDLGDDVSYEDFLAPAVKWDS